MMIVLNTEADNNALTVTFRISQQEFSAALSKAYLDRTDEYIVPGYAAGLAPREAIEQIYGPSVLYDEVLDICIPDMYGRFLKEKDLRIIGKPKITEVKWLTEHSAGPPAQAGSSSRGSSQESSAERIARGSPPDGVVDFTVKADLYPQVVLGEYKGLSVPVGRNADETGFAEAVLNVACGQMKAHVTNAMVEQKLNAMAAQEKLNVFSDAIYHVLADTVEILTQGYRDAGAARPMAQIRAEAMDVMLQAVSGENDELSKERFTGQIRDLVQRYRPLPDDFNSRLNAAIDARARKKADMSVEERAQEVFNAYLGSLGLDEKQWRAERQGQALANVRCDLLLDAVAKAEQLTVTASDMDMALFKIANQSGMEIEQVISEIDTEPIKWQILRDKARKLILDSAKEAE
jgi:trigger factor